MMWDGITTSPDTDDDMILPQTWTERLFQNPAFSVLAYTLLMGGMVWSALPVPNWVRLALIVGTTGAGVVCMMGALAMSRSLTSLRVKYWLKTGQKP